MASMLLRLPSELRTLIIKDIIESETSPPNGPLRVVDRCKEKIRGMNVFYPNRFCKPASNLSETCHQLYHEVKTFRDELCRVERPTYKLDLTVKGKKIMLFDLRDSGRLFLNGSCMGLMARPLMMILNRLLTYGPQFIRRAKIFERLRLNALTLTLHHHTSRSLGRRERSYRRPEIRQECFDALHSWMERLEGQGFLFGKVQQMSLIDRSWGRR